MKVVVLLLDTVTVIHAVLNLYDGYQVMRFTPKTQKQLDFIMKFKKTRHDLDFWREPRGIGSKVVVMVPPGKSRWLPTDASFVATVKDAKCTVVAEHERMESNSNNTFHWQDFQTFESLYGWLDELKEEYSEVEVVKAGSTYEKRDIKGITIKFTDENRWVFIESGIHAREWLAPATTSYVVNQILKSSEDSIFRKFNYVYVPVANPDGYKYSFTARYWRKNRNATISLNPRCLGVDLNRNWDHHWRESDPESEPCWSDYIGATAASEIETSSLADWLKKSNKKYVIVLCFHSFGSFLVYPWGYTSEPAPNADVLDKIAKSTQEAILSVHNNLFQVGSISDVLYNISGSSVEWYYTHLSPTLAYVFELRGNSFVVHPRHIKLSGEEIEKGLEVMFEEYLKLKIP